MKYSPDWEGSLLDVLFHIIVLADVTLNDFNMDTLLTSTVDKDFSFWFFLSQIAQ